MTSVSPPGVLTNVQALRALAALAVICVHILEQSAKYDHPVQHLAFLRNWGDSGVDLFFVISGFIMVYTQRQRPLRPGVFLAHRLWRVVPLYWALTLAYAGLWAAAPALFGQAEIDGARLWASLSFATLYTGDHPILYLGWTLEYEMLFYAVFGLCLAAGGVGPAVALSAVVLAGLWLTTPVAAVVVEFLFGAALGLVWQRAWVRENALVFLAAGLLWLGFTVSDPAHAFENRWFYWGVPSALILAGAVGLPQIGRGVLSYLGDASYSLYLIQVFTIAGFYKGLAVLPGDLPGDLDAALCFGLTLAAGLVCYHGLERPLMGVRRRLRWPRWALRRPMRGV